MKALNKNLVLFMVIVMFAQLISFNCAEASESFNYEAQAQTLNALGLYNGVSSTTFDPDLGTALDRQTGVVMLLRLFGLEADAQALTVADAESALAMFTDAASISSWAKPYVAFAVQHGLVNGLPDGTFAPNANLVGRAYTTMILRQLGYSVNATGYNTSPSALAGIGGLTPEQAALYAGQQQLIRDDLVGISFGSLSAVNNNGGTVIELLVAQQVVDPAAAINAGLMAPPVPPVPPAPQPPVPAPPAPDPTPSNNDDNDDDDEVIVTGVTSSLSPIEQGSNGTKEVNRLTIINGATSGGTLLFSMSDGDVTYVSKEISIENAGDSETVANAVYSQVAVGLDFHDVSLADGSSEIFFTAKNVADDLPMLIELKEDEDTSTIPTGVGTVLGVEVTPGIRNESVELLITHGAIRNGTLGLTINGEYANVPVQAGDTDEEVANKVYLGINGNAGISSKLSMLGYMPSCSGNIITFNSFTEGNFTDLYITLE